MPKQRKTPIESIKSLQKLGTYIKKYRVGIIIAIILALAGAIFSLIGPNKLSDMTDVISEGLTSTLDMDKIARIAWFLVVIFGLSAIFNYIQGVIMATVTQRITQKLRTDIESKMTRLPLRYFDQTNFGDVLSRMTNDVDMVGQTLNQSLATLITATSLFFGSLIMMFITNFWMTIAAILSTILGFGLIMLIMGSSQQYFVAQQRNLGVMNAFVEEAYNGHQIMKAFNGERKSIQKFAELNDNLYNSSFKATFLAGLMMPLMRFVGNLGYVVVCIVGAYMCFNGDIKFGVIVAFMLYIRLFTQPLSQFAQVLNSLQQTAAASDRIFEFLNEEEMTNEDNLLAEFPTELQGAVKFENVKFGYLPDKTIIHDFSLQVNPKETVAIVGPTGAGKSTIVNLLMKFYEVNQGNIYLDDYPLSELRRELVHDQFCMVLQDTWLFDGTVKENIIYNRPNISDEEVIKVCKSVGVDHFIQTLPNGYDTHLTDANNLSQGQKQLLTIARAAISKAPYLILDEATSSVDTRTELVVQEAMDKLMAGRTSFIIAHRLSTIKNADRIIVMRDGEIVEQGNHDSLLAQDGFYAELYNSQFK